MIKLFSRNYILFALVMTTVVIMLYFYILFLNQQGYIKSANMLAQAPFEYLQEQFQKAPESKWQDLLNQLQKNNKYQKISIVNVNNLPKRVRDSKKLKSGAIVGIDTTSIFSPDSSAYNAFWVYQQIAKTDKYLAIQASSPTIVMIQRNTEWIRLVAQQIFQSVSKENKQKIIKEAEQLFGAKVTLRDISTLTASEKESIKKWGIYAYSIDDDHVATISVPVANSQYLVTIGALKDSVYARYPYWFLLLGVLILLMLITFVWSYPFYRSLNKLQKQAVDYGNGKFDTKLKVSKTLALNPLNKGLHKMADQIQTLVASHKELTNAVAHEIKTPLARVRFTLSVLKQKYKTIDQKYINDLDDNIAILDDLVNEILLHAKFDRKGVVLKTAEVSLNQLLQEKVKWFAHKYPDKDWTFKNSLTEITYEIDQASFNRALDNLLNNAYQYGGKQITVSLEEQKGEIIIAIADNGAGISDKDKDKIFEPFERLSESRNKGVQGHGLGLAITKKIIESHHGDISVETTENNQTVFIMIFPKQTTKTQCP
ncbi:MULTISPECIES: sensor histidine kinase [Cysteiniphilum]|uniref:sensor histidine kinase n=1 Tax=Cysteiniphilum TaxID=2056696 RepID=UPI00177BCBDB|nr:MULTISPECIES: ATP-binding protein [Cysteiniphilum]